MNPQVEAALIAGIVTLISVGGTVMVALRGYRATRQATADTIAAQRGQLDRTLAEQQVRTLNERFAAAADKLGMDKPATIRLAGVYAMAGLADDWEDSRQTCIDVLCGYLRIPYVPDTGDGEKHLEFLANREVRQTVIRVIAAHLREEASVSWCGADLDFTGVVFDGGDFHGAEFSGGRVSFKEAEFSGGSVSFMRARFSGGRVDFWDARSSGGTLNFMSAKFSGGSVSFEGAEFSGGTVDFGSAEFSGGVVSFLRARFSGGNVDFGAAEFPGGSVDFAGASFSGGSVSFAGARFSGGTVILRSAKFSGGTVDLRGARFYGGGVVDFGEAEFSGCTVDFRAARFSDDSVGFAGAEFSGGTVDFGSAEFSGGTVHFRSAKFSGGTVDFAHVSEWHPGPLFDWAAMQCPLREWFLLKNLPRRGDREVVKAGCTTMYACYEKVAAGSIGYADCGSVPRVCVGAWAVVSAAPCADLASGCREVRPGGGRAVGNAPACMANDSSRSGGPRDGGTARGVRTFRG